MSEFYVLERTKTSDIQIKCTGADTLSIDAIIEFQGGLKKLSKSSLEKLKTRILTDGFIAPIFIWEHEGDNFILDGHQRLQALLSLRKDGYDIPLIPVDYIHAESIEDAKRKLLSITSQYGEFDVEELQSWLKDLDEEIRDTFRFVDDELKLAFDEVPDETEDDDVVELDVPAISQHGDIWQLGDHRLMCGDATSSEDVAKLMDGELADMIFTDPPYGVSYKGTNNPNGREWEIIEGDTLRGDALYQLLYGSFQQLYAFSRENPAVYVWHASSTQMIFETALNDAGFEVKEQIIWNKGMVMGHSDYHWSHEPCFYARKKGNNNSWFGDRKQRTILRQEEIDLEKFKKAELIEMLSFFRDESTVWEIRKDSAQTYVHPTQKPVDLCMKAIRNNTTIKQNKVLDLFSGSASTIIACEKSHRQAYAMEIDLQYVDVGVQRYIRWCKENGKDPVVLKNGELWTSDDNEEGDKK
jgi:DNA modification methylase